MTNISDLTITEILNTTRTSLFMKATDPAGKNAIVRLCIEGFHDKVNAPLLFASLKVTELQNNSGYTHYSVNAIDTSQLVISLNIDRSAILSEIEKTRPQKRYIIVETAKQYIEFIKPWLDTEKRKLWVTELLTGNKDGETYLGSNDHCTVAPATKGLMLEENKKADILAFFKNESLRSIRDLRGEHIQLLQDVRNFAIHLLMTQLGWKKDEICIYFHYYPSVWTLHLHFTNIIYEDLNSFGHNHAIDDVISNLEIDDNYYAKCSLTIIK